MTNEFMNALGNLASILGLLLAVGPFSVSASLSVSLSVSVTLGPVVVALVVGLAVLTALRRN